MDGGITIGFHGGHLRNTQTQFKYICKSWAKKWSERRVNDFQYVSRCWPKCPRDINEKKKNERREWMRRGESSEMAFLCLSCSGDCLGGIFQAVSISILKWSAKLKKKKDRSFEKGKRMIIIHTSSFSVARLYFLLKKRKMKFMRLGNIKSQE